MNTAVEIRNNIARLEQRLKAIRIIQEQINFLIPMIQRLPKSPTKIEDIVVIEKMLLMFKRNKIFNVHPVFDIQKMKTALILANKVKKQIFQPNFDTENKRLFIILKTLQRELMEELKRTNKDLGISRKSLEIKAA